MWDRPVHSLEWTPAYSGIYELCWSVLKSKASVAFLKCFSSGREIWGLEEFMSNSDFCYWLDLICVDAFQSSYIFSFGLFCHSEADFKMCHPISRFQELALKHLPIHWGNYQINLSLWPQLIVGPTFCLLEALWEIVSFPGVGWCTEGIKVLYLYFSIPFICSGSARLIERQVLGLCECSLKNLRLWP